MDPSAYLSYGGAGVLAHLYGKQPHRELARAVAGGGFGYVQLALAKAFSDLDCRTENITPAFAEAIAEAFEREGVRIPVLGCYVSLIDPDPEAWRANVDRFKAHLRCAASFGARIVATEVGKPGPGADRGAAWKRLIAAIGELADEAEKAGAVIGLEAANGHLIDSAETMGEALRDVPSPNIGVVLDPVNLLHEGNADRQDEVVAEAFRLLGDRVVSLHAKDFVRRPDGGLDTTAAGRGSLHYRTFFRFAGRARRGLPVTLEGVAPEQMAEARTFVETVRESAGAGLSASRT